MAGRVSVTLKYLGNKRLFILMIGMIILIAVMGFTLNRTKLTWPEKFLNDTFGFVQGAIYRPVGAVSDFFRDLGRLSDVYKENELLKQTFAQYTQDQIRFNSIEAEIKRLQDALNFTERQKTMDDYRYLIAHVIAVTTNPYERTIKINLGSRDGVKADMAVTTTEGLIGIVSHVSEFTSTVKLITDLDEHTSKGMAISVTVQGKETQSFGIIEYDEESGMIHMTKIDEKDPLDKNDTVVTSGLGNVFPKGIIVGTVQDRQVGDFGLTHTAIVSLAAKVDHLREVFVVVVPDMDGDS